MKIKSDTLDKLWFNFVFYSATIISAIINLTMFISLSSSTEKPMMAAISLCLEGLKITCLTKRNLTYSVYKTLKHIGKECKALLIKSFVFLGLYLVLGAVAIFASFGFSLTEIQKTSYTASTEVTDLTGKIKLLTSRKEEVINLKEQLQQAKLSWNEFDNIDTDANNAIRTANANGDTEKAAEQTLIKRNNSYNLSKAKQTMDSLQTEYEKAETAYQDLVTQYGGEEDILSVKLQQAKDEQIEKEGKTGMFTLIAQTIGMDEEGGRKLRLYMLLAASFMIEIAIFSFSPKPRPTMKLLEEYDDDLPVGTDPREVIEKANERAKLYKETPEEETVSQKQKLKDAVQKAKEEAYTERDKFNEQTIDRIKSDYEAEIESLKNRLALQEEQNQPKKRGRPAKKVEEPATPVVKRGRGRPRKNPLPMVENDKIEEIVKDAVKEVENDKVEEIVKEEPLPMVENDKIEENVKEDKEVVSDVVEGSGVDEFLMKKEEEDKTDYSIPTGEIEMAELLAANRGGNNANA